MTGTGRGNFPQFVAKIDGQEITNCLRDTGANCNVINKDFVDPQLLINAPTTTCTLADNTKIEAPITHVYLESCYYTGQIEVLVFPDSNFPFILGNFDGCTQPPEVNDTLDKETIVPAEPINNAVLTRQGVKEKAAPRPPLPTPDICGLDVTPERLMELQSSDSTLTKMFEKARMSTTEGQGTDHKPYYALKKGILYRYFLPRSKKGKQVGEYKKQVVVPTCLRESLLRLSHESIFAGHLGNERTRMRIENDFYWPDCAGDVSRFCAACAKCQMIGRKPMKVPLGTHPVIQEAFYRVAMDLIGPLPLTEHGNRYILTVVDFATRYPLALALKQTDSETVAEALIEMFSQVGIPAEVLSDNGPNLTSRVMGEVTRLLSIKHLKTSLYHPSNNGLVERYNGSIKRILRKLSAENPKSWDRYLHPTLFALRDSPCESLGKFSSFELLYGRQVRTPLSLLKHMWTKADEPENISTYQYVFDLSNRLEETCKMAQEELLTAKNKQKKHYDKTARNRTLEIGHKVLILLPSCSSKLRLHWRGPYEVKEKVGDYSYRIMIKNKLKLFHINLLKPFIERQPIAAEDNLVQANDDTEVTRAVTQANDNPGAQRNFPARTAESRSVPGILNVVSAIVIQEDDTESPTRCNLHPPDLTMHETRADVDICRTLTRGQREQVDQILLEYEDILTDKPGKTPLETHHINMTSKEVYQRKAYVLPQAIKSEMDKEIKQMLDQDIIEPSKSPYHSPCLMIKKSDGTYRFVFDARQCNAHSALDAEPINNIQAIEEDFAGAKYFTTIDLSKGYWQIELDQESRPYTAFSAGNDSGLYQFKRMAFGLHGSSATFCRLMRKVLKGAKHMKNYVDDIIIFTKTWEEHIAALRDLFKRLKAANLTARPSKARIGFATVHFVGHVVGDGVKKPKDDKISAITNASRPTKIKTMQSFLGLVGYYRSFIEDFAKKAEPLVQVTRKTMPNLIKWTPELDEAFSSLKNAMGKDPILKLPDFSKKFYLQCDASDYCTGGILLQDYEGQKFPVQYISQKMKPAEINYSTIEKECLAIIVGCRKLRYYLVARPFVILTDHQPLLYLNKYKSSPNPRLMRWSLQLTEFQFTMQPIKGSVNYGADFLSRCPVN